jgi:hypothetical protein
MDETILTGAGPVNPGKHMLFCHKGQWQVTEVKSGGGERQASVALLHNFGKKVKLETLPNINTKFF